MTVYTPLQLAERLRVDMVVLSTTLASFTVLLFDHILTIGDEIKHIWGRKPSIISILFLLNRYFTLISVGTYLVALTSTPMTLVDGAPPSNPMNIQLVEVIVVLSIVSVLIAEIMLILRVSAVYRNNKYIVALLIFLWITHLIMMTYQVTTDLYLSEKHISKISFLNQAAGLIFVVPAVVFDTVVGALLTLGLYRNSGRYRDQMPLVKLIMRDGTLYFLVMFASNITWILVQLFLQEKMGPHSVLRESDLTPLEIWSACITTTMIGRLTLNMKKYNTSGLSQEEFSLTQLRFRNEVSREPTRSHWVIDGCRSQWGNSAATVTGGSGVNFRVEVMVEEMLWTDQGE